MEKNKRKGPGILSKLLNAVILIFALLFTVMGLTDIGQDSFGVRVGFGFGIPLLILYFARLRQQNAECRRGEEDRPAPDPKPVHDPAAEPREEPAQPDPVICPNCGAPGRGLSCEYCGGPLPAPDRTSRRRRRA